MGWSIQSWRSQKAVAIGCVHPTCSGVVDRCQLPPLSPNPNTRCRGQLFFPRYCSHPPHTYTVPPYYPPPPSRTHWGSRTPIVPRRRCSPLCLKQGFSCLLGPGSVSTGSRGASCPRTTRRRRPLDSWVSGSEVRCTRDDATRL